MRIVLAPDKFKGCLSAAEVCDAISRGLRAADPKVQIDACPMADGGEGTVAAMLAACGGKLITRRVTGPLPDMKVDASFALLADGQTAVIEMASASGLALLPPEDRNPLNTTTFGTGELLVAAIDAGAKQIILGIGGSATNDAGIGCAQATGHTICLENGECVSPTEPLTGADVDRVIMIKRHRGEKTDGIQITVACDVDNPLYGPKGAAHIFAPQKGASAAQVHQLDTALNKLAHRTGHVDLANHPGAGAAGGLGFGMMAFFGATLQAGAELMINVTNLRQRLTNADLCITGEGRLDASTAHGKTVAAVAKLCQELNIPCIALAGSVESAALPGLTAAYSIANRHMSLEQSMRESRPLLAATAENLLRTWQHTRPGNAAFPLPR
jgi:glycerate kinase